MLPTEDAATLESSLPQISWFQAQREALGIESYLYVFIRLAAASRVVQVIFKTIYYLRTMPKLFPVSNP